MKQFKFLKKVLFVGVDLFFLYCINITLSIVF